MTGAAAAAGSLIELFWQGANATIGWNITEAAAPSIPPGSYAGYSATDPLGFYNAASQTKHVIYEHNGFLRELSWTLGTLTPRFKDLTIAGVAPALAEDLPGLASSSPARRSISRTAALMGTSTRSSVSECDTAVVCVIVHGRHRP